MGMTTELILRSVPDWRQSLHAGCSTAGARARCLRLCTGDLPGARTPLPGGFDEVAEPGGTSRRSFSPLSSLFPAEGSQHVHLYPLRYITALTLFGVKLVSVTFGFGRIFFDDPFNLTAVCSPFGTSWSRSTGADTVPAVLYDVSGALPLASAAFGAILIRCQGQRMKV